ncbi:Gfo/Idh/MocA family protein [Gemmatimonadota bacterium]
MKAVGLVGCGAWGSNILRDLIALDCRVNVVDIDSGARSKALAGGASNTYPDLGQLPACDGYVVAVPIPDLTKTCADLLRFKKPVFAEKTLCLSLEDVRLLEELGGSDLVFAMHKWHYHPGIEALRVVARSGRIGEVGELSTTRHAWVSDFHGGDVFWTQAVHDLTIIKHILGHIPGEIRAIQVTEKEDGLPVGLTAMLGTGPSVLMSVSGRHCQKRSGAAISGKMGAAMLHDALDDHITVRDERGEERIAIDTTFPLFLELKEFVEHLHGGPPPRCDLRSAREVTQAILSLRYAAGLRV